MENTLKQKIFTVVIPLIAVAAIVVAGYFYVQVRKFQQNPQVIAQQEVNDLIAKVSKLIVLPTGETPTIATVSDLAALKDQPFFANAQKGDKLLVYAQAKKAILYSVTLNKIIDAAPLNIGTQAAITPPATTPPATTATTTSPTEKK